MKLFVCTMTAPIRVAKVLRTDCNLEGSDIFILPLGGRFKEDSELKRRAKKAKALMILDYKDFREQLSLLNKYDRTVILFCPIIWALPLTPCVYLDAEPSLASSTGVHKFIPLNIDFLRHHDFSASYSSEDEKVIVKHEDYLPQIIDNVRQGSLLNALMTLIYKVGSAAVQKSVKEAVIRWLVENGKDKKLLIQSVTSSLVKHDKKLSTNLENTLVTILTEQGAEYLKALDFIRPKLRSLKGTSEEKVKSINYKDVQKKFPAIDLFEVRYLLKTYSQFNYSGRGLEGKDLNKIYYDRERNAAKKNKAQTARA